MESLRDGINVEWDRRKYQKEATLERKRHAAIEMEWRTENELLKTRLRDAAFDWSIERKTLEEKIEKVGWKYALIFNFSFFVFSSFILGLLNLQWNQKVL